MSNFVLDGIMGLAVADALGVLVEFESRSSLKRQPVVGMRAYGTYYQPAGTWSDDTSMTLALVDSLTKGLRQERFTEGLWIDAVKDKVFSKILKRFNQIIAR